MIVTDLDLRRELARAAAKGNYLVAVAYVDKETKKLNVSYTTHEFPRNDIPGALNKLAEMLDPELEAASAKSNP